MNHIEHILKHHISRLQNRLEREQAGCSAQGAIKTFLAADPTQGKVLVDWMVKSYCDGGFKWEDIRTGDESKVFDTMQLYQEHFKKLPPQQRNLYDYNELGAVYAAISGFIPDVLKGSNQEVLKGSNEGILKGSNQEVLRGKELKRRTRERALEQSRVLYRSRELIVAVPLTEEAACWWGKGTRWCTAARKDNAFDIYNEISPIVVIILNGDLKLQLHFDEIYIQFMDANDQVVKLDLVEKHWSSLKPIFYWLLSQTRKALEFFPLAQRTPELCKLTVERDAMALEYVPLGMRTPELCMSAFKRENYSLAYFPEEQKTFELCKITVEQYGSFLWHVHLSMRTAELCWLAVQGSSKTSDYFSVLGDVPEHLKTPELCKAAFDQNKRALQYFPEDMKTPEICKIAVQQVGRALEGVPQEMRTLELCTIAVEQDGTALYDVPHDIITPEICRIAVAQKQWALCVVPEDMKTPELLALAAIKKVQPVKLEAKWSQDQLHGLKANLQALPYDNTDKLLNEL